MKSEVVLSDKSEKKSVGEAAVIPVVVHGKQVATTKLVNKA